MKMATDKSSVSFVLPEFTSLLEGYVLLKETLTTNVRNILDCIKKCRATDFCDAAAMKVKSEQNNCLLFKKGRYKLSRTLNAGHITWYRRKGLVQNVGLIGRKMNYGIYEINIDMCVDKCLQSTQCLGMEFSTLSSACYLYDSITGAYNLRGYSTSWIKMNDSDETV
jgi:hypothetical protein